MYSKLPRICSVRRNHKPVLSSLMTYHDVYCKSSITGANSGAGTAYDSDHLSSPTVFSVVRVAQSLFFCIVFCWLILLLLSYLFWPLHCLSFNLQILIAPLQFIMLSVNRNELTGSELRVQDGKLFQLFIAWRIKYSQ